MQIGLKFREHVQKISSYLVLEFDNVIAQIVAQFAQFGKWIPVDYSPSLYSAASSATWTVLLASQSCLAYRVLNSSMKMKFTISGSAISANVNEVRIQIPTGWKATRRMDGCYIYFDAGGTGLGQVFVAEDNTFIRLRIAAGGNFTTSVGVIGEFEFEVTRT